MPSWRLHDKLHVYLYLSISGASYRSNILAFTVIVKQYAVYLILWLESRQDFVAPSLYNARAINVNMT